MSQSKDINSLVKIKKIKAKLGEPETKKPVESVRSKTVQVTTTTGSGIVSPATLKIYYDPVPDESLECINGTFDFLQAVSAELIDDDDQVIIIDTIERFVNDP